MSTEPVPRDEIAASLKTSRELGPDYDDAVASALAERLDQTIAQQVSAQIDARIQAGALPNGRGVRGNTVRMVMAIVSLGVAVPLTAIGAGIAGSAGMLVAWVGVLMLYFVVARSVSD
ncbi:hypothetical protein NI17_004770 [Thermobifida halotolerans]|uniref:Integral membrane protein n=1 Tax=Thermobifida halotolerans TaxID=483545 RepID=A0AA97LYW2_9ACTN|nr:hypothetical protein [Thermobifida halotolerans]UOE20541.1 hypothetical protein NI17_004770 [Thermobifida halotolerans]